MKVNTVYGVRLAGRESMRYDYIGQTELTLKRRMSSHLSMARKKPDRLAVCRWIADNGFNVVAEVLATTDCSDHADLLEQYYIEMFGTQTLNKTSGGKKGSNLDQESRAKLSRANKGRLNSLEARAKISKANKDRIVSTETKAKMSKAKQGESCTSAKLTEGEVIQLRNMYASGSYSQCELSKLFKIGLSTVNMIIHRLRWTHI